MKAFIDCGAYKGATLGYFRANPRYDRDFKLFALECNPSLARVGYGDDVTVIRAAAWVYDGELKFFRNAKTPNIQGNSVYKEKRTGDLDKAHPIVVPCIDFSAWLKANFNDQDTLVVKMNIEGAEYDVLEKCIADGTIHLIDELIVQWHAAKISVPGMIDRHNRLVAALHKVNRLTVYNGYGHLRLTK